MPTASNTINQLERAGLVSRERALDDRRGVMVQITDLGRQRLELVGEERTKFLAEMLATLDDANLEHISEVTDAIDALANAYTQRPEPRAAL